MWKIWIEKFENNTTEVSTEQNSKSGNNKKDDDILLIDLIDEETDAVFQRYLQNMKKSCYRRTHPAEQAEPQKSKAFKCITCNYVAKDDYQFKEHLKFKHTAGVREKVNTRGQRLQFCHYWNNYGNCTFESRNGRPCKFEHKNAPRCKFDGNCDRKFCMFVHKNQNMSFLLNAQPNVRLQGEQRGFLQNQSNNFAYQNQLGGPKRWGNTRRF